MKVLLINKSYQTGGAAIAARRLWKSLLKLKVDTIFMVFDETSVEEKNLIVLTKSLYEKLRWWFNFIFERIYFLPHEKNKSVRFAFSPAITGKRISRHKAVQNADIIHLHWFNQGFLSLKNMEELIDLGKPLVWTLHDMWAFTGGCHYNNDCLNFTGDCGKCPYLKYPGKHDLSWRILRKKKNIYSKANITFVTCSSWLKTEAEKAAILVGKEILSIPNPIDSELYCPANRDEVRKKLNLPLERKLILFGAANVNDPRKGIRYLLDALSHIKQTDEIEMVLFGKNGNLVASSLPYKTNDFGLIHSVRDLVQLYQAADLFVLPSLQDNLPNTVMESLACGTPVVAFNTGGIPEMVGHKQNGYLAKYKSSEDLASGIEWVLSNNANNLLGKAAREKVLQCYSEKVVAEKYIQLYQTLLK